MFWSSVFIVFLSSCFSSFIGMFSAFRFIVPSNSGSDHLAMSSRIFAAGFSSPLSSALKVASKVRFVWYVLALTSTVVDIFFPAFARRMRFRNCVAASVVPDIWIVASFIASMPSRLLHLSKSSSCIFGGAGSKISHPGLIGPGGAIVEICSIDDGLPHWHGHVKHLGHKCPRGSVRFRFPASSGNRSWASELIIAWVGGFSGAYTLFCWIRTHVPLFTPSIIVCSKRDWVSGMTTPGLLWMFSYSSRVVVSGVWAGHASALTYSGSKGSLVTLWRTFDSICHRISWPGWAVP